jgi:hypothetical protein
MPFDPALNWFKAEGIPITPWDDAGRRNFYPVMRMSVVDASGAVLASTRNTLPVSDEMDCRTCHGSGASIAARPGAGWVFDPVSERDYRLNVLRLHDERQAGNATYLAALAARGLPKGLYRSVTEDRKPALCATCHASEALAGSGYPGIAPLTRSMHAYHAHVTDPSDALTLGSSDNRTACYRCHPGSATRCLRGAMGNAVAADGTMAIQCQNCHGGMAAVGASTRTGWLNEPTCQQCHTGTATSNNGQIRFASVFEPSGAARVAVNQTFATSTGLYRFSAGHGGLQCAACHGSTHAEYPASHANDNLQSVALQGHVGTLAECNACHTASVPMTPGRGPHGMHAVGQAWLEAHEDALETVGLAQCATCHGADFRGTELSRMFNARTLSLDDMGSRSFFRGQQVGCYTCHRGPSSDDANPNRAPVAPAAQLSTGIDVPAVVRLSATDPDGNALTYRIVSQPANGTVGLSNGQATYFPFEGFSGTDRFTWAAWDGSTDSNLAAVTVPVATTPCTVALTATVPAAGTVGAPIPFRAGATASHCRSTPAFAWTFGDGAAAATAEVTHAYVSASTYAWRVTATADGVESAQAGSVVVGAAVAPPVVTRVTQLSSPFRLQLDGSNFRSGVRVFIGTDTAPWAVVERPSSRRLVLGGGSTLQRRFPARTAVAIRVVNQNGGAATTTFTRP